jgi:hypothetical protein
MTDRTPRVPIERLRLEMTGREQELVTTCLRYCHTLARVTGSFPHWRNNVGMLYRGGRPIRFGVPGLPDIFAVLPPYGRLIGIECKTRLGTLSQDQVRVHQELREAGAAVLVVRSLDDLRRELRALGLATAF